VTARGTRAALASALSIVAILIASCATIEAPKVVLTGLEFDGLSADGLEFTLMADVRNPNAFGAEIGAVEYRVLVDGVELATGRRDKAVDVPADGTAEVGVPFTVTWKGAEEGVEKLLDGSEHKWSLKGSATLSKGPLSRTFRFSESAKFTGPSDVDIDL
jgi:LEA14-like dessication related protein